MIRVFIGVEENQRIAQKVLEYSILRGTREEVRFEFLEQKEPRVGGTNFGFVRFYVPKFCGYEGRAIYLDADQIVLGDIRELHEALDDRYKIALVQEARGVFGKKPLTSGNQTSVMVLNCLKLRAWDPPSLFTNVIPNREKHQEGRIHYKDFMRLAWMNPAELQPLDPRWNHFNVLEADSRLVHFSHVRSQPWKSPGHPLTAFWAGWLLQAVRDGYVKRREIVKAILRGHIHARFLTAML